MKYMDSVKVIVRKTEYEKFGAFQGRVGVIITPEIRNGTFLVDFSTFDGKKCEWEIGAVYIGDLELVEENRLWTDEDIFRDLPSPDPHWWCKVEDGYIKNLLGEKKNKIPYDYES